MRPHPPAILVAAMLALAACGGGGGTDAPPTQAPFGLEGNPFVEGLAFDFGSAQPGIYQTVQPWPNVGLASLELLPLPDGSGRMLSIDKTGFGVVFDDDPQAGSSSSWFDLSSQVSQSGGESGLLGAAFHPNFQSEPYLYLFYSTDAPRSSRIVRLPVVNDVPQVGSQEILLEVAKQNDFHNGGKLAFGPDGYLYASLGDDGDPQCAQDLSDLNGSILRLTATGQPAPGNPFTGQAGARAEIWAYGLRNTWRFSFDEQTGELWAADVGAESREEIDKIQAGGNYGWPMFEGSLEYDNPGGIAYGDTVPPLYEYDHTVGQSIIGGYVYRGNELPSLVGSYLYTDSTVGSLWALRETPAGPENTLLVTGLPFPVCIAPDAQGEPRIGCLVGGQAYGLEETAGGGGPAPVPTLLSETGVFSDLATLQIRDGFVPYAPNAPFWSDGALKQRWIGLPQGGKVGFSPSGNWSFPVGTVLVKHFELETLAGLRRLETRVLYRTATNWESHTYRWNDSQTDATRITIPDLAFYEVENPVDPTQTYSQPWLYMTPAQCLQCHTSTAGYVLGARTSQLNGDYDYDLATDNQLRAWNHVELFSVDVGDPSQYDALVDPYDPTAGSIVERARAYLETNCANCHQPNGPTGLNMDLRATTPVTQMNTHGIWPLAGTLGIPDPKRIAPFSKESSIVHERMQRLDLNRMPPVGSYTLDVEGIDLIGQWIDEGAP